MLCRKLLGENLASWTFNNYLWLMPQCKSTYRLVTELSVCVKLLWSRGNRKIWRDATAVFAFNGKPWFNCLLLVVNPLATTHLPQLALIYVTYLPNQTKHQNRKSFIQLNYHSSISVLSAGHTSTCTSDIKWGRLCIWTSVVHIKSFMLTTASSCLFQFVSSNTQ